MKKIFLIIAVTIALPIALTTDVFGQNDLGINEEHMPGLSQPAIINKPSNSTTSIQVQDVDGRAAQNFHKNYPVVTNEEWFRTTVNTYLAMFKEGGTQTIVGFNRNGSIHHTITFYGEDKLSPELRYIVKSIYYDYSITRIAEVYINDWHAQTTYAVYILNGSSSKRVIISSDEILEEQDIRK